MYFKVSISPASPRQKDSKTNPTTAKSTPCLPTPPAKTKGHWALNKTSIAQSPPNCSGWAKRKFGILEFENSKSTS